MFYQYESIGKRKTMWTAVTIAILLLAVSPVRAYDGLPFYIFQEEPVPEISDSMGKITGRIESLQSANGLMYAYIKNDKGETLGRITELVFDRNQGVVDYVVISSEVAHHPVPWSVFAITPDSITLNIEKSSFMQAPSVSRIDLELLASRDFREKINNFYSAQIPDVHISSIAGKPDLCRLDDFKGLDIQNLNGDKLGNLRNLVIDTRGGNIAYGLVGFGGFLRIGEDVAAVPWSSLILHPEQTSARVDATRSTLETAVIDAITLEQLAQPQFARQVHQNFGMEPYWEVLGYVPAEEKDPAMAAWQPGSKYNKCFNPDTIAVIEGTIKTVKDFTPEYGAAAGLKIKVETTDGKITAVHLGPREYVSRVGFDFKPGSLVTAAGSRTKVNGKDVIMATEVKIADKTLLLRDNTGTPKW